MSVNKVILVGRIGKDPEFKNLNADKKVCNFSVATSERYKDAQGESKEQTEWHNIVMWGKLAELADRMLKKGQLVYVEGKLQTRKWQDRDGNDRYSTEVNAAQFTMLGPKPQGVEEVDAEDIGYR